MEPKFHALMEFDALMEPIETCYKHLALVRIQRDRQVKRVEMLTEELKKNSTCSAYDELRFQKEALRDIHLYYMDSAEAAIKRDKDTDRKNTEAELLEQYRASANAPFDNAAKTEKKYTDQVEANEDRRRSTRGGNNRERSRSRSRDRLHKAYSVVDLKPESVHCKVAALEFENWKTAAEIWYEASNFSSLPVTVQQAYLQGIVENETWTKVKRDIDSEENEANVDFKRCLQLISHIYYKQNDQFLLRVSCRANSFKGQSAEDLITWFFAYKQQCANARMFSMTEDEKLAFELLHQMPSKLRSDLLQSQPKPDLKAMLEYLQNKALANQIHDGLEAKKKVRREGSFATHESRPPGKALCYKCGGEDGHIARNCQETSLECTFCKNKGSHNTKACNKKRKAGMEARGKDSRQNSVSRPNSEERPARRHSDGGGRSPAPDRGRSRSGSRDRGAGSGGPTRGGRARTPGPAQRQREGTNVITEVPRGEQVNAVTSGNMALAMEDATLIPVDRGRNSSTIARETVLCDTGTLSNLISLATVEDNDWEWSPASAYSNDALPDLSQADGSDLRVMGTMELWIKLQHQTHRRKVRFLVMEQLHQKVILGLRSMREMTLVPRDWPRSSSFLQESSSDDIESDDSSDSDVGPESSNNVNATQEDEDNSNEEEEEGDGDPATKQEDDETSENKDAGSTERGEKSKHETRDEDIEHTRNCPKCGSIPGWVPSHVRACGMLRFNNTSLRAFANGDIHDDLEEEEIDILLHHFLKSNS